MHVPNRWATMSVFWVETDRYVQRHYTVVVSLVCRPKSALRNWDFGQTAHNWPCLYSPEDLCRQQIRSCKPMCCLCTAFVTHNFPVYTSRFLAAGSANSGENLQRWPIDDARQSECTQKSRKGLNQTFDKLH